MESNAVMQVPTDAVPIAAREEALRQVGQLISSELSLPIQMSPSDRAFLVKAPDSESPRAGIVAARGTVGESDPVVVELELARVPDWIRVSPGPLFRKLSALGERVHVVEPEQSARSGLVSLSVKLVVRPEPLVFSRESALITELRTLDDLARELQEELPGPWTPSDIEDLFEEVREYIEPVVPLLPDGDPHLAELSDWAVDTAECLTGGACVAIVAPQREIGLYAELLLSVALHQRGKSIGRLTPPAIGLDDLIRLNRKSPGILSVLATALSFGGSPYDMTDRVQPLLRALEADSPVVFSGTHSQLQYALAGGQGSTVDPLSPIVRDAPNVPLPLVAARSVREAGARHGGLTPSEAASIVTEVVDALEAANSGADKISLLPHAARKAVSDRRTIGAHRARSTVDHVASIGSMRKTLTGLDVRATQGRSTETTARLVRVLANPNLFERFREELVGQDRALRELCDRARTESLTQPDHLPLRWSVVGTAGVGKSESIVALSRFLGLPYLNVDCGAFASSQAATSALLGSPRGYVGSYQAGVLEKAAKHAGGVVLEASDIDHAPLSARTAIADLFLGVLQTGEAQSAIGARIPCAEMIIVFSYNLLNGMDEAVHKKTGFVAETSRHELQDEVVRQTSDFLSGAFQSRMGVPIVFDMLGPDALATIAERGVSEAIRTAAARTDVDVADVAIGDGVGHHIVRAHKTRTNTFGARALLNRGRDVASKAFTEWLDAGARGQGRVLRVEPVAGGGVALRPERQRTKPVRKTSRKADGQQA